MYSSRTTSVSPGSRCWAWFPTGGVELPAGVPNGFEIHYPASYRTGNWNQQFAWEIRVAPDVPAGTYHVGPVEVHVTGLFHRRKPVPIATNNSMDTMQNALNDGRDIKLSMGEHTIERALIVPDGATISGVPGLTRLVRMPDKEPFHRMFVPQGAMTLRGLMLTHHPDINPARIIYCHNYPTPKGHVTIDSCHVVGGQLQQSMAEGLWINLVRFLEAGTGPLSSESVVSGCGFKGHSPGVHPHFNTGAQGQLTYDCVWDGTTRGQVLQTGPCRGAMNLNLTFTNIRGGENNANEVILIEAGNQGEIPIGQGMEDLTFVDVWIQDCGGPALSIHGSGMSGIRAWHFQAATDHTSLAIAAEHGGQITGVECVDWQATGAIDLRGDCGKLTLGNFQLFDGPRFAPNGSSPSAVAEIQGRWPVRNHAAIVRPTLSNCGSWRNGECHPLVIL